ncbi:MAG: dipeptide ABC transporter ATP-binding protein [Lachnospiraceae bacterium]|nr:dipeptide ABC transporter ATP-binding protein [Lachnospiraceae bacterium]
MKKILEVKNLTKTFQVNGGFLKKGKNLTAVDNVSFELMEGETLCLVGESGCGKSTLGRSILQIIKPTSGEVLFDGVDLCKLDEKKVRPYRKNLQMIFQDPYASLNPRMTIRELIGAPVRAFKLAASAEEFDKKIREVCSVVGISEDWLDKYPHEFSGGQRQRIVIARALILNPKFIVCDEPVSALDVSIRSQVLNLMKDLQAQFRFSYLFVSHDLSVVNYIGDRIAVMYLGEFVELADKRELFRNPLHPYTQALLSAIPVADVTYKRERNYLEGEVPSPVDPPSGCKFRTRCKYAADICRQQKPQFVMVSEEHYAACHMQHCV